MTTTVTIEAHCPQGVEVVITTTGCGCGTNGDIILQDGEKHSTVIYDNKVVSVSERKSITH